MEEINSGSLGAKRNIALGAILAIAVEMTPSLAISTLKRQLRSAVKQNLSTLPADEIASQSKTCTDLLFSLPEYQSLRRISVFLSIPGKEIDTSQVVEDVLAQGKKLYVPFIHRQSSVSTSSAVALLTSNLMDMLSIESRADHHSLEPDSWGIPSIPKHSVPHRKNCLEDGGLDLVVVPGVAFDEGFGRLGHGKGYYDYFLARYKLAADKDEIHGMRMPILVALALKEQIFDNGVVPVDLNDWPMDIIIAGDGRLFRRIVA